MDEISDLAPLPPVVVGHRPARPSSSLSWSLPATTIVALGLAVLTALTFAVDSLGHGALVVLAPLADSAATAPDPVRYVVVLVAAAVSGLLASLCGSVVWDRGSPAAPAAVRGLVVGAAASSLAVTVVALGLGLV